MADKKISQLTNATTPLTGAEVFPVVQSGTTLKASIANVQAAPIAAQAANSFVYLNGTKVPTADSNYSADGEAITMRNVATLRGFSYSLGNEQTWLMNNLTSAGTYRVSSTAQRFRILTGAGFEWEDAVSGTAGNPASMISRMTLANSTGNLTLATGNLVIGTSGKGIDFSATPGTGTSELLADYEEGTFTPTVGGSTTVGTATYAQQQGTYTKIGRLVTVRIYLDWNSGTGAGDLDVLGLPFASASVSAISVGFFDSISLSALNYLNGGITFVSDSRIRFYQSPVAGGAASVVPYDAAGAIVLSGQYFV